MRVVLDTNVVVSAFVWRGRPRILFDRIVLEHRLVTSRYILDELSSTLAKSKLVHKLAALNLTSQEVIFAYVSVCELVLPEFPTVTLRDVKDIAVLGTAVAAGASLLVSGDRHLLELKQYLSVRIVTPAEALAELVH